MFDYLPRVSSYIESHSRPSLTNTNRVESLHTCMNQLFFLSLFLARDTGGQVDISTTTENTYNWQHQLVKDAVGRETVCQSPDGTLIKRTFEGLTCDEECINEFTV